MNPTGATSVYRGRRGISTGFSIALLLILQCDRPALVEVHAQGVTLSIAKVCGIDVDCERPTLTEGYAQITSDESTDGLLASVVHVRTKLMALRLALDSQLQALRAEAGIAEGVALDVEIAARIDAAAGELAIVPSALECVTDPALADRLAQCTEPRAGAFQCTLTTEVELELHVHCRTPAISIEHTADPDAADAATADLERVLTALRGRLPALLVTAERAQRTVDAATHLTARARAAFAVVLNEEAEGEYDLVKLFGLRCAVKDVSDVPAALMPANAALQASLATLTSLTDALGLPAREVAAGGAP